MHRLLIALAAVALAACAEAGADSGPPLARLYFPAGIAHADVPGKTEGVLFVANANTNKRYGTGSIVALQLDALGLPALGASPTSVSELKELKLAETQSVQIASFAGELALQHLGGQEYRLFAPTRSEGMRVYRVQASVAADGTPTLSCVGAEGQNCLDTGASLSPRQFEQSDAGIPRAPSPYGVALAPRACSSSADCCPAGAADCGRTCGANAECIGKDGAPFADVWVTHLTQADSPLLSGLNLRGYIVRLDSDDFSVSRESFLETSWGGSNSVVAHGGWVFASGRYVNPQPNLVRIANRDGVVALTGVESVVRASESRGLALSSDGKRLFVLGRIPDSLITLSLNMATTIPTLEAAHTAWLPEGPNEVRAIARPGRGDLLVISCSTAGIVALYDVDVGSVVTTIPNVGDQPYAIAVDARGTAARIYVSLFGDGRIAVIDVPDVNRPQGAHLAARLGEQQVCQTRGTNAPACRAITEVSP